MKVPALSVQCKKLIKTKIRLYPLRTSLLVGKLNEGDAPAIFHR
jgi:hypothetical protein